MEPVEAVEPVEVVAPARAIPRLGTREWAPWFTVKLQEGSLSHKVAQCVYCRTKFSYVRHRCFQHYGWDQSNLSRVCQKAPTVVKRKFQFCAGKIPGPLTQEEVDGIRPTFPASVQRGTSSASTHGTLYGGSEPSYNDSEEDRNVSSVAPSRAGSNTTRSLRQQDMSEVLQIAKRKELDMLWSSFFYEANVAFNVAKHPAFIKAVSTTAAAGFNYSPPSYDAMRTTHIKEKKKLIKAKIDERTKTSTELYGATICSDGWDNVNRRPLMNVMLVCPAGDVFLGSVDTTGEKKSMGYIAGEMKKYIREIGPQNVVQICTDNAANMLGAMDNILEEYPHMYKQGCCAHILDLLMEDWGKEVFVKDLVAKAKHVCHYIRRHHVPMALFRKFEPKLSLVVPAETRFACNYLMIERLMEVKFALEQVVMAQEWYEYVDGLFNQTEGVRNHARASVVRQTIRDDGFWHQCDNFTHLVKPALVALRTFDGSQPAMGKAWITMSNLKDHVYSLRGSPCFFPPVMATRMELRFDRRWDMMHTDLHYAAALLNPWVRTHKGLQVIGEAKAALNRVFRQVGGQMGIPFGDLMKEMIEFDEGRGPYSPEVTIDIRGLNLEPHQWWQRIGGGPLAVIAKRILSQVCSASSCERNWSMYSFVHNKVRNRLGLEKSEALVYIYTNSRLLRERPKPNPLRWYENNAWSEESDPERDPSEEDGDDDDHYIPVDHAGSGDDDVWGHDNVDVNTNGQNDGNGNGRGDANRNNPRDRNNHDDNGDAYDFNNEPEYNQGNPDMNIYGDELPTLPVFDEAANAEGRGARDERDAIPVQINPENNDGVADDSSSEDHLGNDIHAGDDDEDSDEGGDGSHGRAVDGPHWTGLVSGEGNWGTVPAQGDSSLLQEIPPAHERRTVHAIPAQTVAPSQPTGTGGIEPDTIVDGSLARRPTSSMGAKIARLLRSSAAARPPLNRAGGSRRGASTAKLVPVAPAIDEAVQNVAQRGAKKSTAKVVRKPPSQEPRGGTRKSSKKTGPDPLPFYTGYTEGGPSSGTGVVRTRINFEDGITAIGNSGKERPMKRLVSARDGNTGEVSVQVRNLTSEVEGEVQAPVVGAPEDEGDNEHSEEEDPDCDEAPDDEDVIIRHELGPTVARKRQSSRKKKPRKARRV